MAKTVERQLRAKDALLIVNAFGIPSVHFALTTMGSEHSPVADGPQDPESQSRLDAIEEARFAPPACRRANASKREAFGERGRHAIL